MLDVRCLEFPNGILAASALFHFSSLELVENVSGENSHQSRLVLDRGGGVGGPNFAWSPDPSVRVWPRSSEEGGAGGVCQVDGAFCRGATRGWRLLHESIHGNTCRRRAQHPDPRALYDLAGEFFHYILAS